MVYYFYNTNFILKKENIYTLWINKIIKNETIILDNLNYIFCNDNYLLKLNIKYLNKDKYTDVIAFDNSIKKSYKRLNGDIFISIDRVIENAIKLKQKFNTEIQRVMVHGLLHLIGYNDHNKYEINFMRRKEDFYIKLFHNNYL